MNPIPTSVSGKAVAIAAAMAAATGLALLNRANARKAERQNSVGGSFLVVGGVKLHYLARGEGPPIVLLHGNGSMIQDWLISGLFDTLAETNRVIAFDRPGFGYSDRPRSAVWSPEAQAQLLAKAFERLGIETPVVVGHSFATLVTLAMALNHPASVSRIVLIGGFYYPTPRIDALIIAGPAIPGLGDLMRYTVSPLAGRALEPAANRKLFAPAEVSQRWESDYPIEMAVRPSQIRATAAEAGLMVPAAARLSKRYRGLSLPITIVAGNGDRVVDPSDHSEKLHGELAQSKLAMIPGAGHMVHHTAKAAVHAAIIEQADRPA